MRKIEEKQYKELDIMGFEVLISEEHSIELIQKKIDDIIMLGSLFGYKIGITIVNSGVVVITCYSKRFDSYVIIYNIKLM